MSVDYSTAYCKGRIISGELYDEILKHIEKNYGLEECDNFVDNPYCEVINAWIGGDYFIGVIEYLGSSVVVPFKDISITSKDIDAFYEECYNKYNLNEAFEWYDEPYIITFCY